MDGGTMQGGTGWPSDRAVKRYRCPECGDVLLELDEIEEPPDLSRAWCACGWEGELTELMS